MWRERALKIVLVLVGLLFTAGVYPLIGSLLHPAGSDMGDTMMLSLYVTLGIFLLIAVRNPSAHRSLIAFAAWSSFAHAARHWYPPLLLQQPPRLRPCRHARRRR